MSIFKHCFYCAIFLLLSVKAPLFCEAEPVHATLLSEVTQAGTTPFLVLLKLDIQKDFHLETTDPKVAWVVPKECSIKEKLRKEKKNQDNSSTLFLLAEVSHTNTTTSLLLGADVSWVACGPSICIPGKAHLEKSIPVAHTAQIDQANAPLFSEAKNIPSSFLQASFPQDFATILLFAFLGGIILNFMPCVLPVISLKVFHFLQLRGVSRFNSCKQGLAFSAGVIVSFWALAILLFVFQTIGKQVGWGFQLQEPLFVAVLILVLFILSLGLFGVFEFGTTIASFTAELGETAKLAAHTFHLPSLFTTFCSGVLATFVASPCTGPLLGSAIGFTATLDPIYAFIVFTVLGIGMAFPYFFLSLFPELGKFFPRPGRWMQTFKQLMGFFLLATVLWLLWVLEAETSHLPLVYIFTSLFFMTLGAWVYGTWGGLDRKSMVRAIGKFVALVLIVFGAYLLLDEVYELRSSPSNVVPEVTVQSNVIGKDWVPFSLEKVHAYQMKGIPVFVDVTAKWCLTCQANGLILELPSVKEAFVQYGVVKMVADWTNGDEKITEYLRSLERNGVPVYALYSKDVQAKPVILPEVITPELVIEALKEIGHADRLPRTPVVPK